MAVALNGPNLVPFLIEKFCRYNHFSFACSKDPGEISCRAVPFVHGSDFPSNRKLRTASKMIVSIQGLVQQYLKATGNALRGPTISLLLKCLDGGDSANCPCLLCFNRSCSSTASG